MKLLVSGLAVLLVSYSFAVYGQKASVDTQIDPKSTPAYSMLIQRKVKVQAELETLLSENSSEWPPTKKLQFEFDSLKSEMKSMAAVAEPQVSKLTSGYGALILRRVSLDAEVQSLLLEEGPEWPTVKTRQRELELLDQEIKKQLN